MEHHDLRDRTSPAQTPHLAISDEIYSELVYGVGTSIVALPGMHDHTLRSTDFPGFRLRLALDISTGNSSRYD